MKNRLVRGMNQNWSRSNHFVLTNMSCLIPPNNFHPTHCPINLPFHSFILSILTSLSCPSFFLLFSSFHSITSSVWFLNSCLSFAEYASPPSPPSLFPSPQLVSPCIVPSGLCIVNCSKQRETLKSRSRKNNIAPICLPPELWPEAVQPEIWFVRKKR